MKLNKKNILIGLGFLVFWGLVLFVQFYEATIKQKHQINSHLTTFTDYVTESTENAFYENYFNVKLYSKSDVFRSFDNKSIEKYLNKLIKINPYLDFAIFTNMNGRFIASNSILKNGEKVGIKQVRRPYYKDSWFKRAKKLQAKTDINNPTELISVGDIKEDKFLSKLYGKTMHSQYFSKVLEDEFGEPVGVVLYMINSNWLKQTLMANNKILGKQFRKR